MGARHLRDERQVVRPATVVHSPVKASIKRLAYRSMGVVAHGGHAYCCACGRRSRFFLPYGGRAGAMCPRCGALERHRFLVLHVPDQPGSTMEVGVYRGFMRALVESRGGTYVGVDVVPGPDVDRVADVTALPFADDEFDTVICSHVLEHVQDDRTALSELARVVKPSGTCLIMFPHDESRTTTLEDDTTGSAAERRRLYGQSDHVRIYGRDRSHG
jgi:SAM-dependent methyltransferase